MTEEIIKELAKAGQQPNQAQIAGIVKGIMNTEIPDKDRELCEKLLAMIDEIPKYGNDIEEVDSFAREVAYTYTKPLQNYRNPRGGIFQAGLYPVSANVPLGPRQGLPRTDVLPIPLWRTAFLLRQAETFTALRRRQTPFPNWITA
ncbi:MAG: pyruvate formate lyase family protein [Eisenbergiella sp.]